jgi:hypothetical protein
MTKNEIIDKIQLLLETQSHQGTAYRFKAHQILELIEEAGMLPPAYNTRLDNGLEVRMVDWEPEGEEK